MTRSSRSTIQWRWKSDRADRISNAPFFFREEIESEFDEMVVLLLVGEWVEEFRGREWGGGGCGDGGSGRRFSETEFSWKKKKKKENFHMRGNMVSFFGYFCYYFYVRFGSALILKIETKSCHFLFWKVYLLFWHLRACFVMKMHISFLGLKIHKNFPFLYTLMYFWDFFGVFFLTVIFLYRLIVDEDSSSSISFQRTFLRICGIFEPRIRRRSANSKKRTNPLLFFLRILSLLGKKQVNLCVSEEETLSLSFSSLFFFFFVTYL